MLTREEEKLADFTPSRPDVCRRLLDRRCDVPNLGAVRVRPASGIGAQEAVEDGWSTEAPPPISDLDLFRYRKRIIDLDTEIPNRAFDLGVTE